MIQAIKKFLIRYKSKSKERNELLNNSLFTGLDFKMVAKLCILLFFLLTVFIQCEVYYQVIPVKNIHMNINNNEDLVKRNREFVENYVKLNTPATNERFISKENQVILYFQRRGGVINDMKCPVGHIKIGFICVKQSDNKS